MIYIVQEYYQNRWWHQSFYTDRFYAEEQLNYLRANESPKLFRIKEWQVPEDVE
jgi:hypothetical protein